MRARRGYGSRARGTTVFAVGFGDATQSTLDELASPPATYYSYRADALDDIRRRATGHRASLEVGGQVRAVVTLIDLDRAITDAMGRMDAKGREDGKSGALATV